MRAGPKRATAIVTVIVADETWTAWWRGVSYPPPAAWKYAFEEFTNEDSADEWALAAAIFIARYRRRHSQGPTFRELFEHLLPDSGGVPSPLPKEWEASDRRHGSTGLRRHVAIEWRRRGYIGYDTHVTRSLRVGPRFRERSRALNAPARADALTQESATSTSVRDMDEDSLSMDATRSLLRIPPTSLQRLGRHGYLHVVGSGAERRYPSWQFAGRPRFAVLPGVDAIAPAIPKHWALTAVNAFMMTPHPSLVTEGTMYSPVDWLIMGSSPHRVVDLLATSEAPSE